MTAAVAAAASMSETYNENFTRSWNAIRYAIRSGETFRIRAFQRSCKWDYFPADRSMIGICGFFIQPQIGIYFVELGPEKTKIDFVKGASFCLYRDGFVHDLIEIADKRLHRRFKAKE